MKEKKEYMEVSMSRTLFIWPENLHSALPKTHVRLEYGEVVFYLGENGKGGMSLTMAQAESIAGALVELRARKTERFFSNIPTRKEMISAPAVCRACGTLYESPTTGKLMNDCHCGGELVSVGKDGGK